MEQKQQWFVVRALYSQGAKLAERLRQDGFQVYMPTILKLERSAANARPVPKEVPMLPSIVFLKTDALTFYDLCHSNLQYFSPYYNHFHQNLDGRDLYLVVPDSQMANFMLLTSTRNEHLLAVSRDQFRFKSGEYVRVTDGEFKGVIGRVARIKGQTRVVVEIEGVCFVASAYIPSSFLEKLSSPHNS